MAFGQFGGGSVYGRSPGGMGQRMGQRPQQGGGFMRPPQQPPSMNRPPMPPPPMVQQRPQGMGFANAMNQGPPPMQQGPPMGTKPPVPLQVGMNQLPPPPPQPQGPMGPSPQMMQGMQQPQQLGQQDPRMTNRTMFR